MRSKDVCFDAEQLQQHQQYFTKRIEEKNEDKEVTVTGVSLRPLYVERSIFY